MSTYQFSSHLNQQGDLPVPAKYLAAIPPGSKVRVVLHVESSDTPTTTNKVELDEIPTTEELVQELQSQPLPESLIVKGSGLLGEHLTDSPLVTDPDFDTKTWNQEWARIEAEMNMVEKRKAEERIEAIRRDLDQ